MKNYLLKLHYLLLIVLLVGCKAAIYDQYTYTQTLAIKADAISLIEVANQPFEDHALDAAELKNSIKAMVTYEEAKSNNPITVQMWKYMDEKSSINDFLELWKETETLSDALLPEYKAQVQTIFDLMADYENRKTRETENALLAAIQ
ncbi:MAG: hypothetical protein WBG71_14365 [Leeuwenhoekiella sp.]